jgi:hypothetical protein
MVSSRWAASNAPASGGRVGSADGMTTVSLCGRKFIHTIGRRAQTAAGKPLKSSPDWAVPARARDDRHRRGRARRYCSVPYTLDSRRHDAHKLPVPDQLQHLPIPVSTVSENFVPYAHAEKELCDIVGPLLADVIKEVEQRNGIKIRELRVTMEVPTPGALWSGANCVIVR